MVNKPDMEIDVVKAVLFMLMVIQVFLIGLLYHKQDDMGLTMVEMKYALSGALKRVENVDRLLQVQEGLWLGYLRQCNSVGGVGGANSTEKDQSEPVEGK